MVPSCPSFLVILETSNLVISNLEHLKSHAQAKMYSLLSSVDGQRRAPRSAVWVVVAFSTSRPVLLVISL